MKRCGIQFIILFCLVSVQIACGQNENNLVNNKRPEQIENKDQRYQNLKNRVEVIKQAFLKNDIEQMSSLIFVPREIEEKSPEQAKSFREKGLAEVKQQFEQFKKDGFNFNIEFEYPKEIVQVENNLFSIVPKKSIITIKEDTKIKDDNGDYIKSGRYETDDYEIAISEDNGERWCFWRGSMDFFKMVFPKAIDKIDFPPKPTKPTYYPN